MYLNIVFLVQHKRHYYLFYAFFYILYDMTLY